MKKALLVPMIFFFMLPLFSIAQEAMPKVKEIGVNFINFNNFGIRYKCGTENRLLRLTFLSINGIGSSSKFDIGVNNQNSAGAGFNIGIEKRKVINEKFDFYHGLDLLTSYNYTKNVNDQYKTSNENWSLSPGLGFVFGFRYKINNDFNISAEMVPSVRYTTGKTITNNNGVKVSQNTSGYSFGLVNNNASLTVAYRFGK